MNKKAPKIVVKVSNEYENDQVINLLKTVASSTNSKYKDHINRFVGEHINWFEVPGFQKHGKVYYINHWGYDNPYEWDFGNNSFIETPERIHDFIIYDIKDDWSKIVNSVCAAFEDLDFIICQITTELNS